MRVIAGRYGGRRLVAPRGRATRPTADRVKEALFAALGALDGERVLDLFAGSGALGIEALSRGAGAATFVDHADAAIAAIRRNLEEFGLRAELLQMPVTRALACAAITEHQYDLVFLDPPYRLASQLGPELSAALGPLLASGARVIAESDRREPLALELTLLRERRYGDTLIRVHGAS